MTKEEIKIGKKDVVACNYWKACDYYKQLKRTQQEIEKYSVINEQLQKRFNDYQDKKIEENANLMKKLDIADKKLTVFSRKLEQANKENDKYKQTLKEIKNISDDYNLTVNKRREQIADIINSLLEQE